MRGKRNEGERGVIRGRKVGEQGGGEVWKGGKGGARMVDSKRKARRVRGEQGGGCEGGERQANRGASRSAKGACRGEMKGCRYREPRRGKEVS